MEKKSYAYNCSGQQQRGIEGLWLRHDSQTVNCDTTTRTVRESTTYRYNDFMFHTSYLSVPVWRIKMRRADLPYSVRIGVCKKQLIYGRNLIIYILTLPHRATESFSNTVASSSLLCLVYSSCVRGLRTFSTFLPSGTNFPIGLKLRAGSGLLFFFFL